MAMGWHLVPRTNSFRMEDEMFDILIESNPTMLIHKKILSLLASTVIHSLVLNTAIIVPLFFTETLNPERFVTYLMAPPPPPPPPPPGGAPNAARPTQAVTEMTGRIMAPVSIPREIAMVIDEPMPEGSGSGGVPGVVPGGVPGGTLGGVIGGVVPYLPVAPPPPPPPLRVEAPVVKALVRVGGKVQEPRLISRVEPTYPGFAKQARIEGTVVLEAIITEDGRVSSIKLVSGHPMLVQAAIEAASRWVYEPTRLNIEPVSVILSITVNFRLQY